MRGIGCHSGCHFKDHHGVTGHTLSAGAGVAQNERVEAPSSTASVTGGPRCGARCQVLIVRCHSFCSRQLRARHHPKFSSLLRVVAAASPTQPLVIHRSLWRHALGPRTWFTKSCHARTSWNARAYANGSAASSFNAVFHVDRRRPLEGYYKPLLNTAVQADAILTS
jgi:hypothetical protein